jgi:hypothetical protein
MVKEIVCQVVAHIPKYPAAKDRDRGVPVVKKYEVRQMVEWCC